MANLVRRNRHLKQPKKEKSPSSFPRFESSSPRSYKTSIATHAARIISSNDPLAPFIPSSSSGANQRKLPMPNTERTEEHGRLGQKKDIQHLAFREVGRREDESRDRGGDQSERQRSDEKAGEVRQPEGDGAVVAQREHHEVGAQNLQRLGIRQRDQHIVSPLTSNNARRTEDAG